MSTFALLLDATRSRSLMMSAVLLTTLAITIRIAPLGSRAVKFCTTLDFRSVFLHPGCSGCDACFPRNLSAMSRCTGTSLLLTINGLTRPENLKLGQRERCIQVARSARTRAPSPNMRGSVTVRFSSSEKISKAEDPGLATAFPPTALLAAHSVLSGLLESSKMRDNLLAPSSCRQGSNGYRAWLFKVCTISRRSRVYLCMCVTERGARLDTG